MADHEKRISTNEANIQNIGLIIVEFKGWMKTTSKENNEIISRLVRMETKQDEFRAYQENCDKDRQKLIDRIGAIERDGSRQAGKASIINAIISACVAGGVAILTGIYGGHK